MKNLLLLITTLFIFKQIIYLINTYFIFNQNKTKWIDTYLNQLNHNNNVEPVMFFNQLITTQSQLINHNINNKQIIKRNKKTNIIDEILLIEHLLTFFPQQ